MSSRLDYCNSLFYGIADTDLNKLQYVQNRLTHLVTKPPPFSSSVPLIHSLHWLPVRFRILFKISLLSYKTLHEKQPVYLHSMLAASLPSHPPKSEVLVFWSQRSRPTQAQELFSCVLRLFGTTSHCLSVQPLPSRKIWTHLFYLAFSP